MGRLRVAHAARIVRGGGVIAYPTEAVFGLGCSPRDRRAVMRVLAIKRRSWRKGLILIGASLVQLERYVILPPEPRRSEVLATWPGPHTWVLDALPGAPRWITGGRPSVAVRVTAHPIAAELCRAARRSARLDERQREPAPTAPPVATAAPGLRKPRRLCPRRAARRPRRTHGHPRRPQRKCPASLRDGRRGLRVMQLC
jgi:L-threonylcarbamoyladenylate synthase